MNIRANLDLNGEKVTTDLVSYFESFENPIRPIENEFVFSSVSENEVMKIIKSMKNKTSQQDPIPIQLLKSDDVILNILVPFITKIVNTSLETGVVPTELKNGFVTPILKKANLDRNNFKNYRPVTNTSFLSKILEKIVAKQLLSHIHKYELFDDFQSAYREGHSIETVLAQVKNEIDVSLDNGLGSLLVLLDGSAAFDTLDFSVLLRRLSKNFGVGDSALRWFNSFISGRSQQVVIDSRLSEKLNLTVGIAQGSCLSGLLYLIYQSPLPRIIRNNNVKNQNFADDISYEGNLCLSLINHYVSQLMSLKIVVLK